MCLLYVGVSWIKADEIKGPYSAGRQKNINHVNVYMKSDIFLQLFVNVFIKCIKIK